MPFFLTNVNGLGKFALSVGSITFVSLAIHYYSKKRKINAEKRLVEKILLSDEKSWKKVGTVKEIYCYPLKSGKGQNLQECRFDEYGVSVDRDGIVTKDRMFMVYRADTGKFVTGRDYSKLVTVSLRLGSDSMATLEIPDVPSLIFPVPESNDENARKVKCIMWYKEILECIDCGNHVSKWLTMGLTDDKSGDSCSLRLGVYIPEAKHRDVEYGAWKDHAKAYTYLTNEDTGLYSDLASYMILSEASVNSLNLRLRQPIPARQLRPNIVVEGCKAFAEDKWDWIMIGDGAVVRQVKPCTRCVMTTIDPDTGVRNPEYEPLKTLKTYRKLSDPVLDKLENYAPAIGIYCGLRRAGSVRVGDDVYVYKDSANVETD